jgi:hypothetical protein
MQMDSDDPEKRIAELESQRSDKAGQARRDEERQHLADLERWGDDLDASPPSESPELDQADPEKGGVPAPPRSMQILFTIVVFGVTLAILPFGRDAVYHMYAYHVGIPTTATAIYDCHPSRRGAPMPHCVGTWSVAGKSHSGEIEGASDSNNGLPLDVHARGDTAYVGYVPDWVVLVLILSTLGTSILLAAFAAGAVMRIRSGHR